MAGKSPITIVGGGLAGLALGIGLRQRHVPVTILEAGTYPRHRVCGEFISGRGQATLARLGLHPLLEQAGAVHARSVAFFSATRATAPRPLPAAGICLSRHRMDGALAETFRALGGELVESERFGGAFGEGIVRATGRRPGAAEDGSRWFGLKIHVRRLAMRADLEMHVSRRGYVGLCGINGGEVNVCGLFRKGGPGNTESEDRYDLLRGEPGSPLRQRLADAEWLDDSFCAVAGLSVQPQRAASHREICVGDAITMIPPVTGNGMSMAFESAELAIAPLAAWSSGSISWDQARRKIVGDCDSLFARRLRWAHRLQSLVLTPALQNPLVILADHSNGFWRSAFQLTR